MSAKQDPGLGRARVSTSWHQSSAPRARVLDLVWRPAVNAAGRNNAGRNREGCVALAHSTAAAKHGRSKRGAILVGVLWILVFLGFLAVVLRIHIGSVVASVRVTEDKAAARIIAEAGLARAAGLVIAAPFASEGAAIQDQFQDSVETDTGKVSVVLTNEAWRVDLNTADRPLLIGALRAAGADASLAETLAAQILERRGRQQQAPPTPELANAEQEAPPPEGPAPDADPLQTVAEVALIEGMPEEVALGLRSFATVSSGLKGARLDALDQTVLDFIPGLPSSVQSALDRYRGGTITREQLDQVLAAVEYHTSEKAATWRVSLTVELPAGHSERHEALIMISPDDDAPYRIIDWRRVTDDAG